VTTPGVLKSEDWQDGTRQGATAKQQTITGWHDASNELLWEQQHDR
jgi:hypothetical protein